MQAGAEKPSPEKNGRKSAAGRDPDETAAAGAGAEQCRQAGRKRAGT